ncbi:WS/DGAT/MGAT family O-acyltransferase [Usitatibacter palustris]|uniref:diacylglycerol O-acyltransferase n=1 Tax=Usitatibacter palustris TaxID=2732487 RepID=A0A6M4H7P6_9PROT|nr:wax ester/triacylglycerol synthase family O-acyltransferase [Usitatibacter palustris]QJR15185.1 Putative diacylglycerol O-acyltransferase [Usitatibacter palustris]
MAREKISGVDTAWLRMEHPTNLMMIVGVMMFDGALNLKKVRRIIEARFLAYRRFRQRAVQDSSGAWWEDDTDFDIDSHVHRIALPGKADKAELEALVSDLASTPLDFTKPLWQFHLVDNYAGGGSALILRIHHCYADGIALIQVMLSMTHTDARGSLAMPAADIETTSSGGETEFWEQILKPVTGALENAGQIGKGLLEQGRAIAANPQMATDAMQEASRKGVDFIGEVAKLALMGRDSPTRFKGPLTARKRCAWADPLPLEEVKIVGRALGCSINDVLLAMAAGALRDYLEEHGDPVEGVEIRALVPVNLRPPGQGHSLGNHFGLVFLDLPLGMDHPLERLYEVRRRMRALKGSYQPAIALGLLTAVGHGPRILQEQVVQLLGQNASAVMTNVPGPQHPLYFAGGRIAEQNFWVPQSGGIGMGVSILSYNGRIQFGVITDEGLVPDPNEIVARFAGEFDKLMWLTLMSAWGEDEVAPKSEAKPARASRPKKAKADKAPAVAEVAESAPAAAKVPKRFRNL